MILTLKEIQTVLAPASFIGEPSRHKIIPVGVSIDSRQIRQGELFFALRGEKFDGHDFVMNLQSKALAAVVEESWFEKTKPPAGNFLVVQDSLRALQQCGLAARRAWQGPIVAIGGSNGKTTTKELVSSVLSQRRNTHRTPGNLNNHIGVPLTLGGLQREHEVAVLEVGTNHFGEIAQLCEIAEPDYGLITNIGREHLEFFGDIAGVGRAEFELFDYLAQRQSTALLNIDDPTIRAAKWKNLKAVSFGFSEGAQVHGALAGLDDNGCATFNVDRVAIRVPIPGTHNAINALAAVAVGLQFGVPLEQARAGIESCRAVSKRMEMMRVAGVTFINDAYNANPESMRAALDLLATMPIEKEGRRVAVLADMLELGEASVASHREIGEKINLLQLDAVLAFGSAAREIVNAIDAKRLAVVKHFLNKTELSNAVCELLRRGDVALVKGSRGMAMEEVIEAFRRAAAETGSEAGHSPTKAG